ncbi:hypothetical protein CK203_010966 [Vitis vinifera]|uniref:Uncharacterized protein n=1 Tax=Vitis vinifera TaxID=29760 RepID=A0A438JIV9_VITVI|nr:hypothetical protein CK203_010966 [Vitis vinifera]
MAMMKRVAESAVRAFALGSTSGALTKHLHVSIFFCAFLLQTQLIGWLTDEIDVLGGYFDDDRDGHHQNHQPWETSGLHGLSVGYLGSCVAAAPQGILEPDWLLVIFVFC